MNDFLAFANSIATLQDVDATEEQILAVINDIRPRLRGPDAAVTAAEFKYWSRAYNLVRAAKTRDDIKTVVRQHTCSSDVRAMPFFNIGQGMMKAATHLMWRRLYELEAGQLRTDVAEAVRDAMTPPLQRGKQFMRAIIDEIAAENGESVDAMMTRLETEVKARRNGI
jgi:hypothetical protein